MRVFGIAFGDALLEGQLEIAGEKVYYASGVNIARFPAGGYLHAAALMDKATIGKNLSPFTSVFMPAMSSKWTGIVA